MSCTTPDPGDLPEIVETLARWQPAGGSVTQVHPGDLGWFQRFGLFFAGVFFLSLGVMSVLKLTNVVQ